MTQKDYIKIAKMKLKNKKAKALMIKQINTYYDASANYQQKDNPYKIGDSVYLKKGTLLHGTYKNIDGLKRIINDGLISSWFVDGRYSKYPSSVGVWNLKQDYYLRDYINFYSGGTINYLLDQSTSFKTEVIPYGKMNEVMVKIHESGCFRWDMEQTKEARFMPSLVQDKVQIGIIFNGESDEIKNVLQGDILTSNINDKDVKEFVNPYYYKKFIKERLKKDDFFTDRESAILFGVPAIFIEGILVGREYEKDESKLKEIKELLPNAYICNLDGKVIY